MDGLPIVRSAGSFDAELHDLRHAVAELGEALREVLDASVSTTAPAEVLRSVAAWAREAAARLAAEQRDRFEVPVVDDLERVQRFYNPVAGHGNPMAPPVHTKRDGDRVVGSATLGLSGDDVREVFGDGSALPRPDPRLTPAAEALLHTNVPVIAAVNGPAVGWGMELALFADLRIAGSSARFGELFVKRGLCSDVAGIGRLAQLVGRERAAELLFTGDVIDAEQAERIGLVGRIVDDAELQSAELELAGRIAANPPLAVAALKEGLRRALDPDWANLGSWVSSTLGELFATEDHREGVRSFLEKREPRYVGR